MLVSFHLNSNGVGSLALNRPEKLNSLNLELIQAIKAKIMEIKDYSELRVLIVKGEGKAFSAGGDIKDMPNRFGKAHMTKKRLDDGINSIVKLIRSCRFPVIASIHGACFGAGLVLATACDVLYSSNDAKFGFSYGNVGLIPEASYFISRIIGLNKAKELIFNRSVLTGEEALKLGLANNVFASDVLDQEVFKIATNWASGPVETMGLAKEVLNKAFESTLDDQLKFEALAQGAAFTTDEHKLGVNAFLNKEKPKFDEN